MTTDTADALRRYGWLRLDEDGVERMHNTRDVSDEAMAAYRAYADAVRDEDEAFVREAFDE